MRNKQRRQNELETESENYSQGENNRERDGKRINQADNRK